MLNWDQFANEKRAKLIKLLLWSALLILICTQKFPADRILLFLFCLFFFNCVCFLAWPVASKIFQPMHYSRRCARIELNNRICLSDNSQHYVVSQILERVLIDLFTSFSCCFLNSNKQRLEKCVWCVLLLYNWDLSCVTTYHKHGHNLVLFKFIIKQLEIVLVILYDIGSIPAWDRSQAC